MNCQSYPSALFGFIALLMVAGCSVRSGTQLASSMSARIELPSPSRLLAQRSAAAAGDELRSGAQFEASIAHSHAQAVGTLARFDPSWNGQVPGSAAYAIYRFDLDAFAGAPELHLFWRFSPGAGTVWIGLADFDSDYWEWSNPSANVVTLSSLAPYTAADGTAFVCVMVLDDAPARLTALRFGASSNPVAALSAAPDSGSAPLAVSMDAGDSQGVGGAITAVRWDLTGDGVFEVDGGVNLTLSPTLDCPKGTHSVGVQVTDGTGRSGSASLPIQFGAASFVTPPGAQFDDNSLPSDPDATKWLKNCYKPLPEWRDPNRCFQNAYFAQMADDVLELVNEERAANGGLPPLQMDPHLELLAQAHSRHMGLIPFFDHTNPYGMDPSARLAAIDPPFASLFGENIACGQPTAADVMDTWMNSPGHRANILEPAYAYIGIGIYFHDDPAYDDPPDFYNYRYYWTQDFGALDNPAQHDWLDPDKAP